MHIGPMGKIDTAPMGTVPIEVEKSKAGKKPESARSVRSQVYIAGAG